MLPEDLIVEILARLHPKSILRFRCLSNSWVQTFSNPQFFRLHLHHHSKQTNEFLLQIKMTPLRLSSISLNDERLIVKSIFHSTEYIHSLKLVGSCNGLFCFRHYHDDQLAFLNPSIRKLKFLPLHPNSNHFPCPYTCKIGFGYDFPNNDFKVVRIVYRQVQVYSLVQNSWKVLEDPGVPYYLDDETLIFDGAFHWVANKIGCENDGNLILVFDFKDDSFKEIELPHCLKKNDGVRRSEVKRKLSCLVIDWDRYVLEIWMKMENSNWVRKFDISLHSHFRVRPLVYNFRLYPCLGMNDEEVILFQIHDYSVFSYNLSTLKMTQHGFQSGVFSSPVLTCTSSLALLGEVNHWGLIPPKLVSSWYDDRWFPKESFPRMISVLLLATPGLVQVSGEPLIDACIRKLILIFRS